jgi:DNA-binding transcriptional ArsR family regulator
MDADFVAAAKCLANPARSLMVGRLLDGKALTASELARVAGVQPSTASEHLAQLAAGGLVTAISQGRHRYYSIASAEIAESLEALARICPRTAVRSLTASSEASQLTFARTCYDHLAGKLGVTILDALLARGWLAPAHGGLASTPEGVTGFSQLGLQVDSVRHPRRPFARTCLDWTERRPHLAGTLGAGMATALLDRNWVERKSRQRALRLTQAGRDGLDRLLGVRLQEPRPNS